MVSSYIVIIIAIVCMLLHTSAFEFHAPGQRPEVTRRAIAGLWKLTPALRPKFPMKEFTVHPKEQNKKDNDNEPELLLMLKEDGSFQEYASDEEAMEDESIEDSWKRFREKQHQEKQKKELVALAKGTWDYRDGKLILAADRPSTSPESIKPKDTKFQDTLLEGRVVATYETSLPDNPVLETDVDNTTVTATKESHSAMNLEKRWDAHLTVPKGSVKVGKFFYPKHHPSFFDQPIYNPAKRGVFQLRQILGSLNTNVPEEDQYVEKFQRSDFYNKTFLLTSHPLGQRRSKGNTKWSIKQNKFVQDLSTNKAARQFAEDVENRPAPIRVMQVRFFQNNTFATIWGTGDTILRGKFDVVGQDKDSLWMHISRFGFGRSVSGSVYSEGRMLSQDDAKSYWGTIKYRSEHDDVDRNIEGTVSSSDVASPGISHDDDKDKDDKLEVRGSVLFGAALQPMPIGRFIMRETDESFDSLFDDEEDEDDEEEVMLPDISTSLTDMNEEDGVDWSSDDVFQ